MYALLLFGFGFHSVVFALIALLFALAPSVFGVSIAAAEPAINTLLKIGYGSPEVFSVIANVGDLSGPSLSAAVVDVTSHSTGTPWREKIVTLLDGGDIQLPLFFIPSSPGNQNPFGHDGTNGLLAVFTSRTLKNYEMVFPDQAQTTYSFQAYISKFNFKEPVAGVIAADVTFTITGEPTFA